MPRPSAMILVFLRFDSAPRMFADTRGAQSNAKRDSKPDAADASEELLKFCSKEFIDRNRIQYGGGLLQK